MIKVFVKTGLGERCFKFDFHAEALSFAGSIGSIANCEIVIFNGDVLVDRQYWYNGYKGV